MIEITWKDEMLDELMELAEYIAFNNSDFICTTCIETLERLKGIVHDFYGMNAYMEMDNMIESTMKEDEDYE